MNYSKIYFNIIENARWQKRDTYQIEKELLYQKKQKEKYRRRKNVNLLNDKLISS